MESNTAPATFIRNRNYTEELGSFKIIHTDSTASGKSPNGNKKTVSEYKIVYNETRQTNRHKNPSGVWKHFALATKDVSNNPNESPDDRILCMLCYAKGRVHVYKIKTSSSNLWKHLNRKHNIEIPTEKMFTANSMINFDGFDFSPEAEEHSNGENGNDEHLSPLGVDENGEIVIKTDDLDEIEGFQEEQIIATTIDKEHTVPDVFIKYEEQPPEAVFKDIGLAIIEEVAKRPVLYEEDQDRSPSMRAAVDSMWLEVHDSLGGIIDVDRIQNIWRNISERYKKIRANGKEDYVDGSLKYKYYDHLRFLDNVLSPDHICDSSQYDEPLTKKPRTEDYSYLIEQTDETERNEQNYIAEEIVHDGILNDSVSSITTTIHPTDILTNNSGLDDVFKRHGSPTSTAGPSSSTQTDEFDLFGKFIAEKLRGAPKDRVDLIEIKILQVILENS